MGRICFCAGVLALFLAHPVPTYSADWHYEKTASFTAPAPAPGAADYLKQTKRIRVYPMVTDAAGNIYATVGDGTNLYDGTNPGYPGGHGGVVIFKPDGQGGWTETTVDLSPLGLHLAGGITKMVVAGDGKVYAVQNWLEIEWPYYPWYMFPGGSATTGCVNSTFGDCNLESRILRVNPDGTVDVIKEYSPALMAPGEQWLNRIGGITVGGDGNVYFWYAGMTWSSGNSSWKTHVFFRYNIQADVVEESPTGGVNNGAEEQTRFVNLEYVGRSSSGKDWFAIISNMGYGNWRVDAISWDTNREQNVLNGVDLAGWGHDFCLFTAYDPILKKLWGGSRSQGNSANGTSTIMPRWNGDPANPALFTDTLLEGRREGILSVDKWHANGNNPGATLINNGGSYWFSALAVNPGDSSAWMSWGANAEASKGFYNYTGEFGLVGPIYRVGPADTGPTGHEGNPQTAHPDPEKAAHESQTVSLLFKGTKVYAMTVDLVSREFNLFSADNPAAVLGACCQPGRVCTPKTQGECGAVLGAWQGADSTCEQADCRFQVCNNPFADADGDGDVDPTDFGVLQQCMTGDTGASIAKYPPVRCDCFDATGDGKVDLEDLHRFSQCAMGAGVVADPACDDSVN
jgi:hypothetical protein